MSKLHCQFTSSGSAHIPVLLVLTSCGFCPNKLSQQIVRNREPNKGFHHTSCSLYNLSRSISFIMLSTGQAPAVCLQQHWSDVQSAWLDHSSRCTCVFCSGGTLAKKLSLATIEPVRSPVNKYQTALLGKLTCSTLAASFSCK